jgi:hypothetical protein
LIFYVRKKANKAFNFAQWQTSTPKKHASNPDNYRETAKSN